MNYVGKIIRIDDDYWWYVYRQEGNRMWLSYENEMGGLEKDPVDDYLCEVRHVKEVLDIPEMSEQEAAHLAKALDRLL